MADRQIAQAQAATFAVRTTPVLHANMNCYWIYQPQNYAADVSTSYPLIVFFHGVGESGTGTGATTVNKTYVWGPGKLMQAGTFPNSFVVGGNTFRFLAICPQIKAGLDYTHPDGLTDTIQPALVDAAIEYMKANYRVDVSRIYLCGLSMGGGATLHYAGSSSTFANKLAAIVAACPARTITTGEANVIAAAKLPVMMTINADDGTVNASRITTNMTRLNAYAPAPPRVPRRIQWATGGHNVWSRTYEDLTAGVNSIGGQTGNLRDTVTTNIYAWMLQFTRTAGGITVLPVKWKNFIAQEADGSVSLQWTVTEAKNISSFTVEKSNDGVTWTPVTTIPAQKGNSAEQQYQYTDQSSSGNVFYRIKQTDLDGSFAYSEIRKISGAKKPFSVKIFPSPFDQQLTIRFVEAASGSVSVKLVNSIGHAVVKQQYTLSGNESVITLDNVKHITRGVYYVVVENADGDVLSRTQVLKR